MEKVQRNVVYIHEEASLGLKGKVYESCVTSCMIYGIEAWPMKEEYVTNLDGTEMRDGCATLTDGIESF